MRTDYCCPKCQALLNPDRSIILTAAHADTRVLIGFQPQPGNYEVYLPSGVSAEAGTQWEYSCPVCQAALTAEEDTNLCHLEMRVGDEVRKLLFSRIAGEQATFI
jgi:hypothetical protein